MYGSAAIEEENGVGPASRADGALHVLLRKGAVVLGGFRDGASLLFVLPAERIFQLQ